MQIVTNTDLVISVLKSLVHIMLANKKPEIIRRIFIVFIPCCVDNKLLRLPSSVFLKN